MYKKSRLIFFLILNIIFYPLIYSSSEHCVCCSNLKKIQIKGFEMIKNLTEATSLATSTALNFASIRAYKGKINNGKNNNDPEYIEFDCEIILLDKEQFSAVPIQKQFLTDLTECVWAVIYLKLGNEPIPYQLEKDYYTYSKVDDKQNIFEFKLTKTKTDIYELLKAIENINNLISTN